MSAALVVAGLPPIDLLAVERKKLYTNMAERTLMMARNEEIPIKSAVKNDARIRLFKKLQQRQRNGKMDL